MGTRCKDLFCLITERQISQCILDAPGVERTEGVVKEPRTVAGAAVFPTKLEAVFALYDRDAVQILELILGKELWQSTVLPEVLRKTIDRVVPRNTECTLRRWKIEPVAQVTRPECIQHGGVKCVAPGEAEVLPASVLNQCRTNGVVTAGELFRVRPVLK